MGLLILIHCKVTVFELGFALFISGELFAKAVNKVKSDGVYQYKKGSSRSSSQNDSASEEEKPVKRAKLMSSERNREIENLSNLIASVEDSIRTKQLQLSRAKSLTNFTQCSEITEQIRKLFKEKNGYCKQLAVLQKKESKSAWYHKSKHPSSTALQHEGKATKNDGGLKAVFEKMSKSKVEATMPVSNEGQYNSDSSHDTEILSSSSESVDRNIDAPSSDGQDL